MEGEPGAAPAEPFYTSPADGESFTVSEGTFCKARYLHILEASIVW